MQSEVNGRETVNTNKKIQPIFILRFRNLENNLRIFSALILGARTVDTGTE